MFARNNDCWRLDDDASRRRVLCYVAGALFTVGWFVFVDACVQHSVARVQPPADMAYAVPGLIATLSMMMVCTTPYRAFNDSMGSFARPSQLSCARLWLFVAFLTGFVSMAAAAVIAGSVRYGTESRFAYRGRDGGGAHYESTHQWLGTSTIVQSVVIFVASLTWMATRLQVLDEQAL